MRRIIPELTDVYAEHLSSRRLGSDKGEPSVAAAKYGVIRFIAFSSFGFRFFHAKRFPVGAQLPETRYEPNRSNSSCKFAWLVGNA
jgi:hypothetical protein